MWKNPYFNLGEGQAKYAVNGAWSLFNKILKLVSGLFVMGWVARHIGVSNFGIYSYAQTLVFLFAALAGLGLDDILVRELVKSKKHHYEILGTALGARVIASILSVLLMVVAAKISGISDVKYIVIIIMALTLPLQSFNIIEAYYKSQVLGKFTAISSSICVVVSAAIKITLVTNDAGLLYFASVFLWDAFLYSVILIYVYSLKSNQKIFLWKFSAKRCKELLSYSWPMILSGVAISIYMKIDQIMIGNMLGDNALGYYSAAVRISESMLVLPVVITSTLFPAILRSKERSESLYIDRILYLYRLIVSLAFATSAAIFLFRGEVVSLIFGDGYSPSASIIAIYVWANVFVFLNNASWQWYIAENLQKLALQRLFLGAAINILLNFIWIDRFGSIGAAYATIISYSVSGYFGNFLTERTRPNFYLQSKALLSFWKLKGFK